MVVTDTGRIIVSLLPDGLQIQWTIGANASLPDVRLASLEQTLPNKRLTQQQLDIFFRPILGR